MKEKIMKSTYTIDSGRIMSDINALIYYAEKGNKDMIKTYSDYLSNGISLLIKTLDENNLID